MVDHGMASPAPVPAVRIGTLADALRAADTAWADAVRTDEGLGVGQGAVLRAVSGGATTLGGLGEVIGRDRSTISVTVRTLVGRGLLERTSDPRDRRRGRIRITPAGVEALGRISALEEHAGARVAGALGADEVETLIGLLERLRHGLSRP